MSELPTREELEDNLVELISNSHALSCRDLAKEVLQTIIASLPPLHDFDQCMDHWNYKQLLSYRDDK